MTWQFEEAKNALDEIFTLVVEERPQFVSRQDQEIVLISRDDYEKLVGGKPNFVQHLLDIPKVDDIDLSRD